MDSGWRGYRQAECPSRLISDRTGIGSPGSTGQIYNAAHPVVKRWRRKFRKSIIRGRGLCTPGCTGAKKPATKKVAGLSSSRKKLFGGDCSGSCFGRNLCGDSFGFRASAFSFGASALSFGAGAVFTFGGNDFGGSCFGSFSGFLRASEAGAHQSHNGEHGNNFFHS